jgi:TnpA family transposase
MARRRLLTDEAWEKHLAPPTDEREIVRHYTLSGEDLAHVFAKRSDATQLGYALMLCYLRYPGRALDVGETPPKEVISFVARQIGVPVKAFRDYGRRDETRRQHQAELMQVYGYKNFNRFALQSLSAWLTPLAHGFDAKRLTVMALDELRNRHILLPPPTEYGIELAVNQAIARAERITDDAFIQGLTDEQRQSLDQLLQIKPGTRISWLAWLRGASESPAPRNILALIERLDYIRKLGLDRGCERAVPAIVFDRLTKETLTMTVQNLGKLDDSRRSAALAATAIRLESTLTDSTILMFDKLMGNLASRAERSMQEKTLHSVRDLQGHLLALATACRAVIDARKERRDPITAIEKHLDWPYFVDCVTKAEEFAKPETTDTRTELIARYKTARNFAPPILNAFRFRGARPVASLLDAVEVIGQMYRTGKRTLPHRPPTAFIPRPWRPFILQDGVVANPHAYILCALSELRARLRAGDVWVEGSRQYQDFDSYLIPRPTFDLLKAQGPLPLEVDTDFTKYIARRREALDREFPAVAALAEADQLPDVSLNDGELKMTPLRANTPAEAEALKEQAYNLLPRVKITDLLLEVDAWTGFSDCFTHQSSGRAADNKTALLSTILADGINLGLGRMAHTSRGVTERQLAWIHDWHIREASYAGALTRLIEAHRALPLARIWGDGTTSSSDGQYFRAGSHGRAIAAINARHGNEPGVAFYTHISDQFGPFYTKVIAATASEAPHVLDGLLYHETGLQVAEHYTDTGGATDHVFALCHLFGFRFAPRLRDLKDRSLYVLPDQTVPAILKSQIGDSINIPHVEAHWDEVLRLGTSVRSGTVTASAILRKLAAYPRQNGLAIALREIGRIERTLFTLDWLKNIDLRRRAQAGLNKGEARNALARALFFNRLGEIRDRTFENQVYRASGLNLLVAAIILWNTRYLEAAFTEIGADANPDLIRHVAPLGWEHISFTGDYIWDTREQFSDGRLRPLRKRISLLAA